MEAVNGVSEVDKGGPPAPSPLTGCYLLIVIGEPHSKEHKDIILRRIAKGLLSWDANDCHVDLEKELAIITEQAPEGEDARYGERLIQFASENLVTEVLIHPAISTLSQCMKNLLSSFTRHRHIIHAGYTFAGNGSWILQDGTFSLTDFSEASQEIDVQRVLRAYDNTISLDIHCSPEGDWTRLPKEPFTKNSKVRVNPDDVLTSGSPAIVNFLNYISPFLIPTDIEMLLESSDVVGNIRFSHPTLYVFPGGQGDAALFGINGFNMLVDGGFARKACFWDFVRHLDRLDAVLLTRLNNSNINGISSVLRRKRHNTVYPQIGHFFCNIQERKAILSPDGDKDKDPLLINLFEEGQDLMNNLRQLNLQPQSCYRDIDPINLYHKVGHGTLDMYILSPSRDSKEVREFLQKWNTNDQKLFSTQRNGKEFIFPTYNLVSICALLVWQPANTNDNITRILFPGSSPQHKIFEGLDKIRQLECIKYSSCSAKTLTPAIIKTKLTKPEKVLQEQKEMKIKPQSTDIKPKIENKIVEENIKNGHSNGVINNQVIPGKLIKKHDSTESDKSGPQSLDIKKSENVQEIVNGKTTDEKTIEKTKPRTKLDQKIKPDVKPTKNTRPIDRKVKAPVEKKASPTTPKKTVETKLNGDVPLKAKPLSAVKTSPSSTPAKSAKEANNRKVVESKYKAAPKKDVFKPTEKKELKPERKPISRRPKGTSPIGKAPESPVRKILELHKVEARKPKLEKECTTDSSTVSTPSADVETAMKKDLSKLTPEELEQLKQRELAELKEEQEVVKEIEAVFRKSETKQDDDTDMRKVKSISIDDKTEGDGEEYLIIEKEEIEHDSLDEKDIKESETQKHTRDSEESEKQRKLSDVIESVDLKDNIIDKQEEHQEKAKEEVAHANDEKEQLKPLSKDISITSPDDKVEESSGKKITDKEHEEDNKDVNILESQPDEKYSTPIESGATTAPTLPEDERIPLDEIKEDNGDQVIEEKYVKEDTKEKEIPVVQLPLKNVDIVNKIPNIVGIRLDRQTHIRDIVKTPDEVADLPVHEVVDIEGYDQYQVTQAQTPKQEEMDHEKPDSDVLKKQELEKAAVDQVLNQNVKEVDDIKPDVEKPLEEAILSDETKDDNIIKEKISDNEVEPIEEIKDNNIIEATIKVDKVKPLQEIKDNNVVEEEIIIDEVKPLQDIKENNIIETTTKVDEVKVLEEIVDKQIVEEGIKEESLKEIKEHATIKEEIKVDEIKLSEDNKTMEEETKVYEEKPLQETKDDKVTHEDVKVNETKLFAKVKDNIMKEDVKIHEIKPLEEVKDCKIIEEETQINEEKPLQDIKIKDRKIIEQETEVNEEKPLQKAKDDKITQEDTKVKLLEEVKDVKAIKEEETMDDIKPLEEIKNKIVEDMKVHEIKPLQEAKEDEIIKDKIKIDESKILEDDKIFKEDMKTDEKYETNINQLKNQIPVEEKEQKDVIQEEKDLPEKEDNVSENMPHGEDYVEAAVDPKIELGSFMKQEEIIAEEMPVEDQKHKNDELTSTKVKLEEELRESDHSSVETKTSLELVTDKNKYETTEKDEEIIEKTEITGLDEKLDQDVKVDETIFVEKVDKEDKIDETLKLMKKAETFSSKDEDDKASIKQVSHKVEMEHTEITVETHVFKKDVKEVAKETEDEKDKDTTEDLKLEQEKPQLTEAQEIINDVKNDIDEMKLEMIDQIDDQEIENAVVEVLDDAKEIIDSISKTMEDDTNKFNVIEPLTKPQKDEVTKQEFIKSEGIKEIKDVENIIIEETKVTEISILSSHPKVIKDEKTAEAIEKSTENVQDEFIQDHKLEEVAKEDHIEKLHSDQEEVKENLPIHPEAEPESEETTELPVDSTRIQEEFLTDDQSSIQTFKEDSLKISKIDKKLQELKESISSETPSTTKTESKLELDIVDKFELGRKSPKEREQDVAIIVASVAEVLKSDAPLEEFEGKIPLAVLETFTPYTTELRETHITTLESPIKDVVVESIIMDPIEEEKVLDPTSMFINEERKIAEIHIDHNGLKKEDDTRVSSLLKDSTELMQATSKMLSDIKQSTNIDTTLVTTQEDHLKTITSDFKEPESCLQKETPIDLSSTVGSKLADVIEKSVELIEDISSIDTDVKSIDAQKDRSIEETDIKDELKPSSKIEVTDTIHTSGLLSSTEDMKDMVEKSPSVQELEHVSDLQATAQFPVKINNKSLTNEELKVLSDNIEPHDFDSDSIVVKSKSLISSGKTSPDFTKEAENVSKPTVNETIIKKPSVSSGKTSPTLINEKDIEEIEPKATTKILEPEALDKTILGTDHVEEGVEKTDIVLTKETTKESMDEQLIEILSSEVVIQTETPADHLAITSKLQDSKKSTDLIQTDILGKGTDSVVVVDDHKETVVQEKSPVRSRSESPSSDKSLKEIDRKLSLLAEKKSSDLLQENETSDNKSPTVKITSDLISKDGFPSKIDSNLTSSNTVAQVKSQLEMESVEIIEKEPVDTRAVISVVKTDDTIENEVLENTSEFIVTDIIHTIKTVTADTHITKDINEKIYDDNEFLDTQSTSVSEKLTDNIEKDNNLIKKSSSDFQELEGAHVLEKDVFLDKSTIEVKEKDIDRQSPESVPAEKTEIDNKHLHLESEIEKTATAVLEKASTHLEDIKDDSSQIVTEDQEPAKSLAKLTEDDKSLDLITDTGVLKQAKDVKHVTEKSETKETEDEEKLSDKILQHLEDGKKVDLEKTQTEQALSTDRKETLPSEKNNLKESETISSGKLSSDLEIDKTSSGKSTPELKDKFQVPSGKVTPELILENAEKQPAIFNEEHAELESFVEKVSSAEFEKKITSTVPPEKIVSVIDTKSEKVTIEQKTLSQISSGRSSPEITEITKDLLDTKKSPILSRKSTPEIVVDSDFVVLDRLSPEKGITETEQKSFVTETKDKKIEENLEHISQSTIEPTKSSVEVKVDVNDVKSFEVLDKTLSNEKMTDEPSSILSVAETSYVVVSKDTEISDVKEEQVVSTAGPSGIMDVEAIRVEEVEISRKSTPDIADVIKTSENEELSLGRKTPPTAPVSPVVKDKFSTSHEKQIKDDFKISEIRSSTPASDDCDISSGQVSRVLTTEDDDEKQVYSDDEEMPGSPLSATSQIAHSTSSQYDFEDSVRGVTVMDPMSTSLYGALPDDPIELSKDIKRTEEKSTEKDTSPTSSPSHIYEITTAKYSSLNLRVQDESTSRMLPETDIMAASFIGSELPSDTKDDPIASWGKPLGLPSPAPINDNKGTPKKERKIPSSVVAKNKLNEDKKNSDSKLDKKGKKINPVYVDLTYVPHNGNSNYSYVDFFKRIRARYYVFSGIEPSKEVYNALLEAKQTWDDKDLEVTIIPTYDTDVLGYWVAENEDLLAKYKIDLSPSASRCTINLQDHETSCSAYRLEFS